MARRALTPLLILLLVVASACGSDTKSPTAASGSGSSASSTHRSITILQTAHSMAFLPLYIAKRMGYFDDVNLDVSIGDANGDGAANTALLIHGDGYALITGPEQALLAQNKGVDLRAIHTMATSLPFAFVGQASFHSSGNLANDLRGKKIAVPGVGAPTHESALVILRSLGLDPTKDVTFVEGNDGARAAALSSGAADFNFVGEPSLEKLQRSGVASPPLILAKDVLGDYPAAAVMVLGKELDGDPSTAQRVADALVRAEKLIAEHPDQALAAAQAEFSDVDKDVIQAAFEFQTSNKLYSTDGKMSDAGIARARTFASSMGSIPEDQLDISKAFDHRFGG